MTNPGSALIHFWRQTYGPPSESPARPQVSTSTQTHNPRHQPPQAAAALAATPTASTALPARRLSTTSVASPRNPSNPSSPSNPSQPAALAAAPAPSPLLRRLALPPRQQPSQRRGLRTRCLTAANPLRIPHQRRVRERSPPPGPRGQRTVQRARTRRGACWGAGSWRGGATRTMTRRRWGVRWRGGGG